MGFLQVAIDRISPRWSEEIEGRVQKSRRMLSTSSRGAQEIIPSPNEQRLVYATDPRVMPIEGDTGMEPIVLREALVRKGMQGHGELQATLSIIGTRGLIMKGQAASNERLFACE